MRTTCSSNTILKASRRRLKRVKRLSPSARDISKSGVLVRSSVCFLILSLATVAGCHRLPGISYRTSAPSRATPLGRLLRASERNERDLSPSSTTNNRQTDRRSSQIATSSSRADSDRSSTATAPERRLARLQSNRAGLSDRDDRSSPIEIMAGPAADSLADNRIEIIETDTPDADLEKDLELLPPQLRDLLIRQLAATNDDAETEQSLVTNWEPSQKTETGGVKVSLSDSGDEDEGDSAKTQIATTSPPASEFISVEPGKPNDVVQLASAETVVKSSDQSSKSTRDLPEVIHESSASMTTQTEEPDAEQEDAEQESELNQVSADTWSQAIQLAIEKLEFEMVNAPPANSDVRLHQEATLRMLRLANGRLDDALDPIEGLNQNEREYFRHQLQAFYEATNPDSTPVRKQRWSLVMNSQQRANQHLSAVSNLMVTRVALCTDVQGFGQVIEFDPYQFRPDQDVLLYCELDNVASEAIQDGFETQLQGSYEIVDPAGNRIADQLLPMEKEVCQNARRDYFIVYRIYMPPQIADGNYELRLTIEDMKAKKFGQKSVDFQIAN